MTVPGSMENSNVSEVRVRALSRWDNEGGAPASKAQDLQVDLETESGADQRDTAARPSKATALKNGHLSNGPS